MTSTRAINAAAHVVHAAMQQGKTLPASIAYALDSAGLLNSPEHAAEVANLRVMYDAVSQRENDLIEKRDALLTRVDALEIELTGSCLDRWEEEQDAKRARFAAKLARQRAAKLRARVAELIQQRDRIANDTIKALADDAPLSPYYEHPACGFHWHGRDGMDVPARDGQPVCPRCELAALHAHVAEQDRVIDGLRALLPTEPREERGLPNDLAHEAGWYGAWQQVAEVLGESLPYARPADEDPIRYSLTPADEWPHSIPAGTPRAVDPQPVGEHCGPNEECHGACPACRPAPSVEALHASSGAVIEVPARREQSTAKLRDLIARHQAAVETAHETPPRPRPVPHDLPEVTP